MRHESCHVFTMNNGPRALKSPTRSQQYSDIATKTVPNEAYSIRAPLGNVKTESHKDSSDMKNGLAVLMPFGDFYGGDFCCKELGVQFPLQPGDICALRGHEISHCTKYWYDRSRYCVVHAFHETVMNQATEKIAREQDTIESLPSVEATTRR